MLCTGTHHLGSVVPGKVTNTPYFLNGELIIIIVMLSLQEGGNKALVSQDRTTVKLMLLRATDFDKGPIMIEIN